MSIADELERLADLRSTGALSEEEYVAAKTHALGTSASLQGDSSRSHNPPHREPERTQPDTAPEQPGFDDSVRLGNVLIPRHLASAILAPPSSRWDNDTARTGFKNLAMGLLVFAVGLAITIATYASAKAGSSYVVMRGAIFFGAVQAVVGFCQVAKGASRGY